MKKRILSVFLCAVCILLTFCGCGNNKNYALSVEGTKITTGIYTFYLGNVLANPEKFGLAENAAEEDVHVIAKNLVKKYIAVNTMAAELGITLSYGEKSQVANETDNRWNLFSSHYEKSGITKQDLHKTITNEAYKMALLDYYYGENSKIEPVSTKKLKKAFTEKYIGVKIIAAPLTTTDTLGNIVPLDDIEMKNTRSTFENLKKRANGGTDIDTLYTSYNSDKDLIGTESLETYVFTKNDTQYGSEFFSKVSKLDYEKATVIEFDNTIYLFYRVDITGEEYNYFYTYKSDVLADLKLNQLNRKIDKKAESLTSESYSDKTSKIYKLLTEIHPLPTEKTEVTE
ncbi:MAG: hypothetical protein IKA56_05450 [Clostridia bacterium]|nr:hypothetical protein [Clostridia bacterium]